MIRDFGANLKTYSTEIDSFINSLNLQSISLKLPVKITSGLFLEIASYLEDFEVNTDYEYTINIVNIDPENPKLLNLQKHL